MALKIAGMIWLTAALCNAILIGLVLIGVEPGFFLLGIFYGLVITIAVSVPAFLLLWAVIAVCIANKLRGMNALLIVLVSALVFTVATFYISLAVFELGVSDLQIFFYCATLSTFVGVAFQHSSILNLSLPPQQESHEN